MPFASAASLSGSRATHHSCKPFTRARQPVRPLRARQMVRAGLFDFLPGGGGGRASPRAKQLVDELIAKASPTAGGARASSAVREEIQELVRFC